MNSIVGIVSRMPLGVKTTSGRIYSREANAKRGAIRHNSCSQVRVAMGKNCVKVLIGRKPDFDENVLFQKGARLTTSAH